MRQWISFEMISIEILNFPTVSPFSSFSCTGSKVARTCTVGWSEECLLQWHCSSFSYLEWDQTQQQWMHQVIGGWKEYYQVSIQSGLSNVTVNLIPITNSKPSALGVAWSRSPNLTSTLVRTSSSSLDQRTISQLDPSSNQSGIFECLKSQIPMCPPYNSFNGLSQHLLHQWQNNRASVKRLHKCRRRDCGAIEGEEEKELRMWI